MGHHQPPTVLMEKKTLRCSAAVGGARADHGKEEEGKRDERRGEEEDVGLVYFLSGNIDIFTQQRAAAVLNKKANWIEWDGRD
jgi:hypothetical protein